MLFTTLTRTMRFGTPQIEEFATVTSVEDSIKQCRYVYSDNITVAILLRIKQKQYSWTRCTA